MLQKMHEYIKGWVAGVIVALIGATFVFWGVASYVTGSHGDKAAVAKVGSESILVGDFSSQYKNMKRSYLQQSDVSKLSSGVNDELKQYLLNQLISQSVSLQAAKSAGFSVSMDQVKSFIEHNAAFQVGGRFSPQLLQAAMYRSGVASPQAFVTRLQDEFIINQIKVGLMKSNFVLPYELRSAYELINETRNVGYFTLDASDFMSKVALKDSEIKAYYDSHKSSYSTPEEVSFQYVQLDPANYGKSIVISDDDVSSYYNSHISNYSTPETWDVSIASISLPDANDSSAKESASSKLESLKSKIKPSASFNDMAKQDGITVADQTLTSSNKMIDGSVLSSLKKGDISNVIVSNNQVMLVQVNSITPAVKQTESSVKDTITKLLQQQQVETLMAKDTKSLGDLVYTNPDSLDVAAKDLNLTIHTTDLMTSAGDKSGLFADKLLLKAAFSDVVLKQSYNSDPVNLGDGSVVVVRTDKVVPSKVSPLTDVSAQISDTLTTQKASQLAGVAAFKVQQDLESGSGASSVASKFNLKWNEAGSIDRQSKDLPKDVVTAVFTSHLQHDGHAYNNVLVDNKKYYVFKVDGWIKGDFSTATEKDISSLREQLLQAYVEEEYASYLAAMKSESKIKINSKILDGIN